MDGDLTRHEIDERVDRLERAFSERLERLERRVGRLEEGALPGARAATPAGPLPAQPYPTPTPAMTDAAARARAESRAAAIARTRAAAAAAATGEAAETPISSAEPAVEPSEPVWRPVARRAPAPEAEPGGMWSWFRIPSPDFTGSLAEIEDRMAGRALAWVGGVALILGAIFFLSLAFSRGWIGPEARVLLGLVAGIAAVGGGWWFLTRGNKLLGHVLTPVGIAIVEISLVGATTLYGLIPAQIGLLGALVCAVAAAVIAVREDSQVIALYGLIAVLLAPPLMQAPPDLVTLLFVAAVLVGTTTVALWRAWSWLPPTAFLLSAPQFLSWIVGEPEPWMGLAGIGGFWLINAVAAGGEAFRRKRDDLSPTSATVLLADAAFAVLTGFLLLDGDLVGYRAFFLVLLAAANIALAAYFLLRDGEFSLFGMLAAGTGIAALTMAAPVGLGAPVVPIAWSAEAVALVWLAARRGHPYSGFVAGVLYGMAGLAVVWATMRSTAPAPAVPFGDPAGIALGFFLASVGAGLWFLRDRHLRSILAAFGVVIALPCVADALEPAGSVVAYTALAVIATAVWRIAPLLPSEPIVWQLAGPLGTRLRTLLPVSAEVCRLAELALPGATALTWVVATLPLMGPVWNDARMGVTLPGAANAPFIDVLGATLAIYLTGLAATAVISGRTRLREPLAAIGLLVVAWACAAELSDLWLVTAWGALMVVGATAWRGLAALPHEPPLDLERVQGYDIRSDHILLGAALTSGAAALGHVLLFELPLIDFGAVTPPAVPFTDTGAVAALILIAATLLTGAILGGPLARRLATGGAVAIVAYTIPFEVYAWAVVILWVALGAVTIAFARLDRPIRYVWALIDTVLIVVAAAVWLWIVAPPVRLIVGAEGVSPTIALESAAAGAAVVAGLVLLALAVRPSPWSRWSAIAAGVALVYLLSILVVDAIATQVQGVISLEERRFQAQVALSVLWTLLGVASLVAGTVTHHSDLRHGGLALLGLATAKVFLVDLSALDVAYRVVSLVVLGLVLLAAAWLWQHSQPKPPIHGGLPGASA